jgi:hypothetical protein
MHHRLTLGLSLVGLFALCTVASGDAAPQDPVRVAASIPKKCAKHRHHFRSKAGRRWYKRHCGGTSNKGSGGGGAGGGEAPCPNTSASPGQMSAQEDDTPLPYRIKLSRTSIDCGKVILEQQNVGEDPHDLVLQKVGNAAPSYFYGELGPGLTARQTLDLTRGSWLLYCDLPGHREAGMERTLTVD